MSRMVMHLAPGERSSEVGCHSRNIQGKPRVEKEVLVSMEANGSVLLQVSLARNTRDNADWR